MGKCSRTMEDANGGFPSGRMEEKSRGVTGFPLPEALTSQCFPCCFVRQRFHSFFQRGGGCVFQDDSPFQGGKGSCIRSEPGNAA